MKVNYDIVYQPRKMNEAGKFEDDGLPYSGWGGRDLIVPDLETAARMANALATGFHAEEKKRYENPPTMVSVLVFDADTKEKLVQGWPASTKYYVERD